MSDRMLVTTIEGLYDRKVEHCVRNINSRRLCLRHRWTDASLEWRLPVTWSLPDSISCYSDDVFGSNRLIRYCIKCKQIDCPHKLDSEDNYRIKQGAFVALHHTIKTCSRCGVRLLTGGSTCFSPPAEAQEIIEEVWQGTGLDRNGYGSGFFCELPVQIAEILEKSGRAAAKQYTLERIQAGQMWATIGGGE